MAEVSLGRLQAGKGEGSGQEALLKQVPLGLALPTALALLLSHRICHRGCALGTQLVSPSVFPAQGHKAL